MYVVHEQSLRHYYSDCATGWIFSRDECATTSRRAQSRTRRDSVLTIIYLCPIEKREVKGRSSPDNIEHTSTRKREDIEPSLSATRDQRRQRVHGGYSKLRNYVNYLTFYLFTISALGKAHRDDSGVTYYCIWANPVVFQLRSLRIQYESTLLDRYLSKNPVAMKSAGVHIVSQLAVISRCYAEGAYIQQLVCGPAQKPISTTRKHKKGLFKYI